MFPQFGATAETLSKASTIVFRIGTDAHLYDDPEDVNIASLLDSKFDSEKCEALKRLLALIAQGFDVSNFFPQVVKNVASQSLEVKKLVYVYLLHYAERRPNEALLSINSFQKDLGDPNPLVRAWALRTMAGIRLHVIAPLVLVAVGKCTRDPSVYVRKCAANALTKLNDLPLEENSSTIIEV
uniref:Clathrin/coatomer adaptor adaptin-like N-terminal domain-containing protein n=1 Tax=Rhizophora mucronata TaxID=61149 RepID=A0A2P2JST7_RHIMU